MKKKYVYIVLGHRSFFTGKICIVEMDELPDVTIDRYAERAKEKACKALGLDKIKDEVSILDWSYLGGDVTFVN
jgi:hypothetical protein